MEGSKALTREQKFRVASVQVFPTQGKNDTMRKLLIVQKGAKVSADGFLKFAEEIRDLTRIYDQNLTKITEITLWVGH